MGDGSGDESKNEEQQSGSKVRAHHEWSQDRRQHVTEDVLNRMCIDRRDADRRRPLVMHLVNATVQVRNVKQTGGHTTNSNVLVTIYRHYMPPV